MMAGSRQRSESETKKTRRDATRLAQGILVTNILKKYTQDFLISVGLSGALVVCFLRFAKNDLNLQAIGAGRVRSPAKR